MTRIAETNAERGAFICSRCEQQTMKLIDCMCESCNQAIHDPKKRPDFVEWAEQRDKSCPGRAEAIVYEATPIDSILHLWKGVLKEKRADRARLNGEIDSLISCIDGLERNLR